MLPLDDRGFAERRAASKSRRDSPRTRSEYVYHAGVGHVAAGAVPFTLDRSYSIRAQVTLTPGDEGVIVACGGVCGGYSLYVKDGAIVHDYNYYQTIYRASAPLRATGHRRRSATRSPRRARWPASAASRVDGVEVATVEMPATYRYFMDWEGLDVGRDARSPATPAYAGRGEFAFQGTLDRVVIRLEDDAEGVGDHETTD